MRVLAMTLLVTNIAYADPRIGDVAPARPERDARVTVVEFVATWCRYCHAALADLDAIARKRSGVDILVIDSGEDAATVDSFFAAHPLPATARLQLDPDGALGRQWGRHAYPTTFVVDEKGIIRFINRGYGPGYPARLEQKIRGL